jgi:hypothetical protein
MSMVPAHRRREAVAGRPWAFDVGYGVLTHLAKQSAATQLAFATAIGHDKSRLIALLDELERDGLVLRELDPADRRNRRVRLTAAARPGSPQYGPTSMRWRTTCSANSLPTSGGR